MTTHRMGTNGGGGAWPTVALRTMARCVLKHTMTLWLAVVVYG